MSETENQHLENQETLPVGESSGGQDQVPEKDSPNFLELRRQNQDLSAKIAVLEDRLLELRPAAQAQPMPQAKPEGDEEARRVFEAAINDGDPRAAAERLGEYIAVRGQSLGQETIRQVRDYIQIERQLEKARINKPWLEKMDSEVKNRILGYVQAGHSAEAAAEKAVKDYDKVFEGLQPKAKSDAPLPEGARAGVQGSPPPKAPPAKEEPESPHSYVERRQMAKMERARGARPY